jgi:hypothetical protein
MADQPRRSPHQQDANDKQRRRKPAMALRGVVITVLLGLAGVALLMLAVPRTVAAWASLGQQAAIIKIDRGETPTVEELNACVEAGERASRWIASATRSGDVGSCEYGLALGAPMGSAERAAWFARAEEHTQQSLIQNPADGFNWFRLALIRLQRGAGAREIVPLLITSLDTAPNARLLWPKRSEFLLFYAPQMNLDERLTARQQLRTIWTYSPAHRPRLLEAAYRLNRRDVLTWVLSDDPEAMAELRMMERQSRFP